MTVLSFCLMVQDIYSITNALDLRSGLIIHSIGLVVDIAVIISSVIVVFNEQDEQKYNNLFKYVYLFYPAKLTTILIGPPGWTKMGLYMENTHFLMNISWFLFAQATHSIYALCFLQTRFSTFLGWMGFLYNYLCCIAPIVGMSKSKKETIYCIVFCFLIFVGSLVQVFSLKYISDIQLNLIQQKIQKDQELINLLNNLDENILILEQNDDLFRFDYVNKRFLSDFDHQINETFND